MFQFCVVLVTERRLSYVHLHISQMRAFSAWLAVHNSQATAIGVGAPAVARTSDQNQFTKNIRKFPAPLDTPPLTLTSYRLTLYVRDGCLPAGLPWLSSVT